MGQSTIGIGVIGLGVIGRRMIEQTAERTDLRVVCAWDLADEARQRARSDHPDLAIATDAQALLADPAVDLLYVGTPPASHRRYVEMAVAAARPVFCEKPLAISLTDGRRIVDALASTGLASAVNFVFASAPAVRALDAMLRRGVIGEPVAAEIRLRFARWPRDWQAGADWLRFRAEGGFVREVLSHFVFLLLALFDSCEVEGALVDYPDDPALCERSLLARLRCAGLPVVVCASAGGAGPDTVEFTVHGATGALRLENWYELSAVLPGASSWSAQRVDIAPYAQPRTATYQAQLDNLVSWFHGRPSRLPDAARALRVQQIVEKLLEV